MFPTSSFLQIPSHDGHPCLWLYPSHYRADSGLTPVRNGAVAISFNDTRYSINRNTVLDDIVCIWLNATAPIKTLKTCIYTGYQRFNRLFELFFPVRCKSCFTLLFLANSYHFDAFLSLVYMVSKLVYPNCTQWQLLSIKSYLISHEIFA